MEREKKTRLLRICGAAIYAVLILVAAIWFLRAEQKWLPLILLLGLILLIGVQGVALRFTSDSSRLDAEALDEAYIDPVTAHYNFMKFKQIAEEQLRRSPTQKYIIFYSDIRNFKYINDVYGFETGNRILKRYSDLLGAEQKIAYARVNADNFVSVETYTDDNRDEIISKCLDRLSRVSNVSGIVESMPSITISVGAYCTNGDNVSMTIDAMIDRALLAQKRLKERGDGGCLLYSEEFRLSMLAEQSMENRMRGALENGEFVVYLQPKFDISTRKAAAAEALVRWVDPRKGVVPPMEFIPLFERNGFIRELDTYMFEEVCKLIRKWLDMGAQVFPISVNVSKVQLQNPTFLDDYIRIKRMYEIPDGLVEIEFTESVLFDNSERMTEVLNFFKENGFRSSIDDFGAGYSSLNLLKKLPADIIKLDRLFFNEYEYQDREKVIIKNVIAMAKDLSMQTVAEGVEQWDQVEFLQSVCCEMVQGFVFDRPQPAKVFEEKYVFHKEAVPAPEGKGGEACPFLKERTKELYLANCNCNLRVKGFAPWRKPVFSRKAGASHFPLPVLWALF